MGKPKKGPVRKNPFFNLRSTCVKRGQRTPNIKG